MINLENIKNEFLEHISELLKIDSHYNIYELHKVSIFYFRYDLLLSTTDKHIHFTFQYFIQKCEHSKAIIKLF